MNRKIDLLGALGLLLTVFALLFGDNIYERITGRPLFESIVPGSSEVPPASGADLPTPTALLPSIYDARGVRMILIPAGEFIMGSESYDNESPTRTLYIDGYYIDQYEVTNRHYRDCVDTGVCTPPVNVGSYSRESYFGNADFDDYPVVNVDRNMASTYCQWRGARLPGEAEWEKAARGTDGRKYPWGDLIDPSFANYNDPRNPMDTSPVGTYDKGRSPFGIYDMAGNVWEWVADSYADTYQGPSASTNQVEADGVQYGELRGGSWNDSEEILRSSARFPVTQNYYYFTVGFRCAKDVVP